MNGLTLLFLAIAVSVIGWNYCRRRGSVHQREVSVCAPGWSGRFNEDSRVNEARFKAVFNGLSSIAQKVYEAIPDESYYSIKRIHSEVFRNGKNLDVPTLTGVLNTLTKAGVLSEVDQGMFSKVKITKKVLSKAQEIEYADTKLPPKEPKKEIAVPEINAKQEADAFDSLRETVIKFMDVAKLVNTLSAEVDAKLAVVEKQLAANNQQMAKYKQLKSLLSDI